MCIDPAKRYTATMDDLEGHHRRSPSTRSPRPGRSTTSSSWPATTTSTASSSTGSSRASCSRAATPRARAAAGPGYRFADELPKPGRYQIGSLAMANAGPDTNGSQFFIISGPDGVAPAPQYSLFGAVVSGGDVVAAIDAVGHPLGHAQRAGGHRVGDHRRGRLSGLGRRQCGRSEAAAQCRRAAGAAVDEDRDLAPAGAAPGPAGVPDERGALGHARPPAAPAGARATERCSFSPWASSSSRRSGGPRPVPRPGPSPTVSAPPRGSTIGSVSTMAPAAGTGHHRAARARPRAGPPRPPSPSAPSAGAGASRRRGR